MRNKFRKDTMNLIHVNIHDEKQYARYTFSYKSSTSTNDDDMKQGLTTLNYLLKLGESNFNKYVRQMILEGGMDTGLYHFLYSVPELSYISNPYKIIMGYTEVKTNGEHVFSISSYEEMMEAINSSFELMEEDFVLNKNLFLNIVGIIVVYKGFKVERKITLSNKVLNSVLATIRKDNFKFCLDNGYAYIRDIIKSEMLKNK